MADQNIYDMSDTWNNGSTTFIAIKMNATDSASASDSKLLQLQIGSNDKFAVDKDGSVTLTNNDAGAAAGPVLSLYRNSATPAAEDVLGKLLFQGEDDGAAQQDYAEIYATIADPSAGTEDASMVFRGVIAGTMTTLLRLTPDLSDFDLANAQEGLKGHIYGLTLSNNTTDAANDIDIAVGSAASDGSTSVLMTLSSGITKQLDAAWAVGDGNGGLDTGTVANSTWYYVWLIRRSDTGVVDALFSTSESSPTMPTNYDQKRRLPGAIRTNSSGSIMAFIHDAKQNYFRWVTRVKDLSSANPGTSGSLGVISAPPNTLANVIAILLYQSASGQLLVTSPDETDSTPSTSLYDCYVGSAAQINSICKPIKTDSYKQIRLRISDSSLRLDLFTLGFWDNGG